MPNQPQAAFCCIVASPPQSKTLAIPARSRQSDLASHPISTLESSMCITPHSMYSRDVGMRAGLTAIGPSRRWALCSLRHPRFLTALQPHSNRCSHPSLLGQRRASAVLYGPAIAAAILVSRVNLSAGTRCYRDPGRRPATPEELSSPHTNCDATVPTHHSEPRSGTTEADRMTVRQSKLGDLFVHVCCQGPYLRQYLAQAVNHCSAESSAAH
jgi:hypothetical protein